MEDILMGKPALSVHPFSYRSQMMSNYGKNKRPSTRYWWSIGKFAFVRINFSYLGQKLIIWTPNFQKFKILSAFIFWKRLVDKERRYPKLFAQSTVFKRYIYYVILVQPRKKVRNSRIIEFSVFIEQNLKNIWHEQKV